MKTIIQFTSIESFSTERLTALKLTENDLEKFIMMHNDKNVMATLGGIRTLEQTKENLDWNLTQWKENGFGLWMFYTKDTQEWIGRAGLRRVEIEGSEVVELGYSLMPAFWNKGFATEMARACVEIAFEVLRLDNIVCFTLTTNKTSQGVMKKVGFQYERDFIYFDKPHVLCRIKSPRKVKVVTYDPQWPNHYQQESKRLQKVLGDHLREIYHIGSTAVPNMPAKPVIDVLLVCENLDAIDEIAKTLNGLNYYNLRRHVVPHRSFFIRREDENISFHLHIRERGDPQINRHVNFRDYLITHPDEANHYAQLKIELAKNFSEDIHSYIFGKDKLVQAIDTKAKTWPQRKKDYLPPNTGIGTHAWSQQKLIKAMEANLNVHMTHFAQYLNQVELIRIPGFTIVNSGLPDDTFNYVLEADFSSHDANQKIKEITDYFTKNKVPFSWWVSPYDQPDHLTQQLENNGYINTENNIAMYFDLDAWDGQVSLSPGLQIIQATDEKTLKDFALVLTNDQTSFKKYFEWIANILTDDDPIEYYVGYVDDKPVVRGLSCYFAQVAGLHWLSTVPSERNLGHGQAMQRFRLKRAKERGYHVAVLQASPQGHSLYKKLGYKECGIFREFKLKI